EEMTDPALLLEKEEYPADRRAAERDKAAVFCYFLNMDDAEEIHWPEIQEFAKQRGKTVKVAAVPHTERVISSSSLVYPSPEEWLGYYEKAEYIFTNTFHGTVFAIIFRKKFLVFLQEGKTKAQNGRLVSLLKKFDLENRFYHAGERVEEQMERPIDWNTAEKAVICARERAALFLKGEGGGEQQYGI
ncbi:polysaccharide pyruvyl transferase family protein, partial [Hungatella effluvii]